MYPLEGGDDEPEHEGWIFLKLGSTAPIPPKHRSSHRSLLFFPDVENAKRKKTNIAKKTIACSFFLYFACIAPAVTFGAIYGKATNNYIGAIEMIAATAWCGCVYALVGGQPMMINGGTGPVLAFSEIVYKLSVSLDVPFLTFNAVSLELEVLDPPRARFDPFRTARFISASISVKTAPQPPKWIGVWVAAYMMIAAVVDLNRIIVLCTRFADE